MRRLVPAALFVLALTAPAFAAPVDDVKSAMLKLARAHAYHVAIDGGSRAAELDFIKPDRVHMTSGPMEMVSIPPTTWVKVNGNWMKLNVPNGSGPMSAGMSPVSRAQAIADHPETMVTVTDRGTTTVDGVLLHMYVVQQNGDAKPMTLGVGPDGYPRTIESTDASGKTSRVRFSQFDDPAIVIAAPS